MAGAELLTDCVLDRGRAQLLTGAGLTGAGAKLLADRRPGQRRHM